jgi:hypothetical protein
VTLTAAVTLVDFTNPRWLVPSLRGPDVAGVLLHAARDAAKIHPCFQKIPLRVGATPRLRLATENHPLP